MEKTFCVCVGSPFKEGRYESLRRAFEFLFMLPGNTNTALSKLFHRRCRYEGKCENELCSSHNTICQRAEDCISFSFHLKTCQKVKHDYTMNIEDCINYVSTHRIQLFCVACELMMDFKNVII